MLEEKLHALKLTGIADHIESFLQEATKLDMSYTDLLEKLCDEEMCHRDSKRCESSIRLAKFPIIKTLDNFDYSYQPSINTKQIQELTKCRWIANYENLIFLGPPGVGKTHLAISLGIEATKRNYRTLFIGTQALLAILAKAQLENNLEEKLKYFCQPKLLIIDEMGYLPFDKHGAHLFFQLVSRRYEKGAMLLTSNKSYIEWGSVLGDQVLATAILDRLLHHALTINIKGDSYRMKEKYKSGIVKKSKLG